MNSHDLIYPDYQEKTILIIRDPSKSQLLDDPKYESVIIALRKGPLTIRELEERYNEIVKENVQKMDLSNKEKEHLVKKLERKSKTLYKYINILEENGFVIQAGKRIIENQTATETLFGRTARLFLFQVGQEVWGSTEHTNVALDLLSKLIGLISNQPNPTSVSLKNILNEIENKMNSDIEMLLTKFSEELPKIAEKADYNQLKIVLFGLNILLLMKNFPNFEKKLKEANII